MPQTKTIFIYGFALFAMFFGSGNLIFPIQLGQMIGERYWLLGFLGLFITGIILPFLGLFVVKLHRGSYNSFFAEAGSLAKIILPLFTLSLLGSFGVVPRCITVAYVGINYLTPDIPLRIFSIIFCLTTFYFCLKDHNMVNILGKWMSPIKLLVLAILIISGVIYSNSIEYVVPPTPIKTFYNGFITGYQTMDLFAAFFFSALIFGQIQKTLPAGISSKETIKFAVKSSVIGALLLAVIYLGFVFLGAHFSSLIATTKPEYMLATIAEHVMGKKAALFISLAMLFSCLAAAIALNNIYARYLCNLFRLGENKFIYVLAGTTLIAFLVSLFDFKGIAAFLAPALEVSYPSVIALTILSILTSKLRYCKIIVFYGILIVMIFIKFM